MGKTHTPEERAARKERKHRKVGSSKTSKVTELEVQADPVHAMAVDEPLTEKSKKSSKKRRREDGCTPVDSYANLDSPDAPKKKKIRKQDDLDTPTAPDADSLTLGAVEPVRDCPSKSQSKKKKEKMEEKEKKKGKEGSAVSSKLASSSPSPESLMVGEKRKKKKDKKGKPEDIKSGEKDDTPLSPNKKKSKPRENKTDLPDPSADESLQEKPQALKALEYAFTQFNNPSEWKFNKAKQNWLVRNVWSDELIPDVYLPLAIKYLAQIQGGSRDKVKETCRSILAPPSPLPAVEPEADPKSADVEPTEPSQPKPILKHASAGPGQPVAGAIIVATPEAPKGPPANVKKERALILFDALASSP